MKLQLQLSCSLEMRCRRRWTTQQQRVLCGLSLMVVHPVAPHVDSSQETMQMRHLPMTLAIKTQGVSPRLCQSVQMLEVTLPSRIPETFKLMFQRAYPGTALVQARMDMAQMKLRRLYVGKFMRTTRTCVLLFAHSIRATMATSRGRTSFRRWAIFS